MAWLRDCRKKCQLCGLNATVEVFNKKNSSHGCYCTRCGDRELARLQREERERTSD